MASNMYGKGPVKRIPKPRILCCDEKLSLLGYIKRNDCKSFDELVGSVLNDLRPGGDPTFYRICFDCPALCVDYCNLQAKGALDWWADLMESGFVT